MIGTEKQIKWATDIKEDLKEYMNYLNECFNFLKEKQNEQDMNEPPKDEDEKNRRNEVRKHYKNVIDALNKGADKIYKIEEASKVINNYKDFFYIDYGTEVGMDLGRMGARKKDLKNIVKPSKSRNEDKILKVLSELGGYEEQEFSLESYVYRTNRIYSEYK